jgi:hypothetical protein
MAARITSHFKRLYAPRINFQNINWPTPPDFIDEYPVIFSGDTAYIGARFHQKPEGKVTINAAYDDGRTIAWTCGLSDKAYEKDTEDGVSVLARTIAAKQMTKADKDVSLKLALDYQLLSEKTACYVEVKLAENQQSDGQPEIRKVPGMLASGYSGLSEKQCSYSIDSLEISSDTADMEYLEIPAFLRRSSESIDIEPDRSVIADDMEPIISETDDRNLVLSKVENFYNKNNRLPINKLELLRCNLKETQIYEILSGSVENNDADSIVIYLYSQLILASGDFSKQFSRFIRTAAKLIKK